MGKFKEHGVMLFLSPELYLGFVRLQADKGLGRSYAGLLPFVEGLFHLSYISKEVYEKYRNEYSKPLVSEKPAVMTKQEKMIFEERKKLDMTLGNVASQWEIHPEEAWRNKWISIAKQNHELPNSKLVLNLAGKEVDI